MEGDKGHGNEGQGDLGKLEPPGRACQLNAVTNIFFFFPHLGAVVGPTAFRQTGKGSFPFCSQSIPILLSPTKSEILSRPLQEGMASLVLDQTYKGL